MIADLTPREATPRMEYWKQIVGSSRSFSIERTMSKKNADGTESHVTLWIETVHEETHLIVSAPPELSTILLFATHHLCARVLLASTSAPISASALRAERKIRIRARRR